MYINLENFYIDTTSIKTLAAYQMPNKEGTEFGLLLNGKQYSIYNVQGVPSEELLMELTSYVQDLIKQIISVTRQRVVDIEIPRPDMTKFTENKKESQKELIND